MCFYTVVSKCYVLTWNEDSVPICSLFKLLYTHSFPDKGKDVEGAIRVQR